jgi:hypothetical protein
VDLGSAQLARQHRYVIKDKFPYYDFFLAFEDDMLVTKTQVQQHWKLMKRLNQLKATATTKSAVGSTITTNPKDKKDWTAPLTLPQLQRMRPGFIRVEVLQKTQKGTQTKLDIPLSFSTAEEQQQLGNNNNSSTRMNINPMDCCNTTHLAKATGFNSGANNLQPKDIMIWETGILGMTVRSLTTTHRNSSQKDANHHNSNNNNNDDDWVAFLQGPPTKWETPAYWTGTVLSPNAPLRPSATTPHFLAQSAGWMATPAELLELHSQLCEGGFMPPFDMPRYPRDGFWKNNVEYWSGGIQMWCGVCGIQRVLSIADFSKHLLYHTSNNKQHAKPRERLALAQDVQRQLQVVQDRAQQEIMERKEQQPWR